MIRFNVNDNMWLVVFDREDRTPDMPSVRSPTGGAHILDLFKALELRTSVTKNMRRTLSALMPSRKSTTNESSIFAQFDPQRNREFASD